MTRDPSDLEKQLGSLIDISTIVNRIAYPLTDKEHIPLFHGSAIPGITDFKHSQRFTFGKGFYLTNERDKAEGYAKLRFETRYDGEIDPAIYGLDSLPEFAPIVYEFNAENMVLAELITPENMLALLPLWAEYLRVNREELIKQGSDDRVALLKRIHGDRYQSYIGSVDLQMAGLSSFISNVGRIYSDIASGKSDYKPSRYTFAGINGDGFENNILTEFLEKLGFHGLIGREGGDGNIGKHYTFVIFNPEDKTRLVPKNQYLL